FLGLILHERLNDRDQGLAAFRQAVRVGPHYAWAHMNLGLALLAGAGKADEAAAALEEAVRLNPNYALGYIRLGWARTRQGDKAGAVEAFRKAAARCQQILKANPHSAPAYWQLGLARTSLGDSDGALQAYRDAVRLDPNNPVFHTDLAMFLGNTGRPEEALPEFTRALELNRASADAHMGLSNCQNGLGLLDEAIVSARKAIDL